MTQELVHSLTRLCDIVNFILVIYAFGLICGILTTFLPNSKKESKNLEVYNSDKKLEQD